MNSFLEIGEIIQAVPNPITVIPKLVIPRIHVPTTITPKTNDNSLIWWGLLAVVVAGSVYYNYIKTKKQKDEDTNTRNKS
jgi:hypothetical protein